MTSAISPRSQSSAPRRLAASTLSSTDAASPFMNTLRTSFSPAASPGSAPTTSTGIPSGPHELGEALGTVARRERRSPDAPRGHGPEERHVGEPRAGRRDHRGDLALERGRGRVQVGVELRTR